MNLSNARWDAMRDAVVADGDPEVVVTMGALEAYFNRRVAPEDAASLVIEGAQALSRAARATPADDGTITLTARILASRDWEVDEHAE